jgi:5-methylcytosine-specific restriction endonuclease McrA
VSGVLNEPVLVLNRSWRPTIFLPVQTAVVTAMRDQAAVLDPETCYLMTFDEWVKHEPVGHDWIRTSTGRIAAPQVIVLKKYGETPPKRVSFSKPGVHRRDDYTCQYCGVRLPQRDLQLEHVVPRSRGGQTTWENTVAACGDCNQRKSNKTPQEAGMKLRRKPGRPAWTPPRMRLPSNGKIRDSWIAFLDKDSAVA